MFVIAQFDGIIGWEEMKKSMQSRRYKEWDRRVPSIRSAQLQSEATHKTYVQGMLNCMTQMPFKPHSDQLYLKLVIIPQKKVNYIILHFLTIVWWLNCKELMRLLHFTIFQVFSKRNEYIESRVERLNAITTLVETTAKHSQFEMKINWKWEIKWKFFETYMLLSRIFITRNIINTPKWIFGRVSTWKAFGEGDTKRMSIHKNPLQNEF